MLTTTVILQSKNILDSSALPLPSSVCLCPQLVKLPFNLPISKTLHSPLSFVPRAFWCCIIYDTLRLQYFLAFGIVNHSLHLPFRTAETLHYLSNSTSPIRKINLKYSKIQIYPNLDRNHCGLTQWKNVCACLRAWVQKRIIWRQNGGTLTAILRDYKTQIVAMPISSVRMIFCANNDRCVPKPKVL